MSERRALMGSLVMIAAPAAVSAVTGKVDTDRDMPRDRYVDLKRDFHAAGDGISDDTAAFEAAIERGARELRPIAVPSGAYRITRALVLPPNTMLVGSSPGGGFGCRIEPVGCPAFVVGGAKPCFHSSIQDMMIWPRGKAPAFIVSVDNSYSIRFQNLRIHEAQSDLGRAAVWLLGDTSAGGHGRCNDIIWENLIVRNDVEQPAVAILAAAGCGTHRFIAPCLENYATLLEWQGGQIDLVVPYTERAGQYAINCNTSPTDSTAFLNTHGGIINSAESGVACAIRSSTGTFNSFGTHWATDSGRAAQVYSIPQVPVVFHGIAPNLTSEGRGRFAGIPGWRRAVRFPQASQRQILPLSVTVRPQEQWSRRVRVPGMIVGEYGVHVVADVDVQGLQLGGYVDGADSVTVTVYNPLPRTITLAGTASLECRPL